MNFQDEIRTALREGKDHNSLLELVRRRQAEFSGPKEVYHELHEIWLEFGFDDCDQQSCLRDNLEFIMEKVWYGSPPSEMRRRVSQGGP